MTWGRTESINAQTGAKDHGPNKSRQPQRRQDRRRADILGPTGQLVPFEADAVNDNLDARIEEFDDHDQDETTHQQRFFDASLSQPKPQRGPHDKQVHLKTKGFFVQPGRLETPD